MLRNCLKEYQEAQLEQRVLASTSSDAAQQPRKIKGWQNLESAAENGMRRWIDLLVEKLKSAERGGDDQHAVALPVALVRTDSTWPQLD